MELEFIALDKAGEESEWIKNFLEDIPLWLKLVMSIVVYCDCNAVSSVAKNVVYNGKSRHIRRRHNTIKQLLFSGVITIDYIKSKENIVDPLTKGLPRNQVQYTMKGMGSKANILNNLAKT